MLKSDERETSRLSEDVANRLPLFVVGITHGCVAEKRVACLHAEMKSERQRAAVASYGRDGLPGMRGLRWVIVQFRRNVAFGLRLQNVAVTAKVLNNCLHLRFVVATR